MWWNQLTLRHTCWIIAWSRPFLNFWGLSLPAQLSLQSVTFWKLTRQANIASSSISFANWLWLSIMIWNGVITLKWSTFPFWCWLQAATALPEISHNTQFDWSVPVLEHLTGWCLYYRKSSFSALHCKCESCLISFSVATIKLHFDCWAVNVQVLVSALGSAWTDN